MSKTQRKRINYSKKVDKRVKSFNAGKPKNPVVKTSLINTPRFHDSTIVDIFKGR